MSPRPFRFLDLPPELRLMVYERIPVPVCISETHFEQPLEDEDWDPVTYTIITQSTTALAILSTCRQIYREAAKILDDSVSRIAATPPRMIADVEILDWFGGGGGRGGSAGPVKCVETYLDLVAKWDSKKVAIESKLSPAIRRDLCACDKDGRLAPLMRKWVLLFEKQRQIPNPEHSRQSIPTLEIALRNDHFTMHSSSIFCQRMMSNAKDVSDIRFVLRLSPDLHQPGLLRHFQRRAAFEEALRVRILNSHDCRACHGEAVDATEFENEWTAGEFYLDDR